MNDHSDQPSTGGQTDPLWERPPLPFSASHDPLLKSIRSRARWSVLALLLSVGLLGGAVWIGQPYWEDFNRPRASEESHEDNINLPGVTVEVHGML